MKIEAGALRIPGGGPKARGEAPSPPVEGIGSTRVLCGGLDAWAPAPESQDWAVIEAAEECPGECIFIEV